MSKTEEVFSEIDVGMKMMDIKMNRHQVYIELLEEGSLKDGAKETTFEMNTNTVKQFCLSNMMMKMMTSLISGGDKR